ncbi:MULTISPECIES: hypothetical protein [unclassified Campylobacter]|uniref:hypothetical protein n=1 Tax=unclassified Campylobacter TaxID=2593542 RepID=UPI0022E9B25C|nr:MULTISPECIES: hypothetical protein [unclassified Campylobacter]MDA3079263.1 hypothetical protein [Campylobacter sp. CS_NA2]MDA3080434.1 hypothetical protein [Campylobacter sp. CS_NA1]MDA3085361.1 hypothetical protein [Campylobacter sp. CS_ED1]MDA3090138.1 hypothetical protein [Campylobacter sp. CS_ED2]WBR51325.1 hypothetical protein PF026_00360 [Campylobacter sp. CS_NA3]
MQTFSIQTDNINVIQAIQALANLDPNTIITCENEPRHLSEKDENELQKIYEKSKSGKLKLHTDDEVRERLAKKGIKW